MNTIYIYIYMYTYVYIERANVSLFLISGTLSRPSFIKEATFSWLNLSIKLSQFQSKGEIIELLQYCLYDFFCKSVAKFNTFENITVHLKYKQFVWSRKFTITMNFIKDIFQKFRQQFKGTSHWLFTRSLDMVSYKKCIFPNVLAIFVIKN